MASTWIVLLEAVGNPSDPPLGEGMLRELMRGMECEDVAGLHDPHRHALQLQVAAATPAEALFSASARWADSVRRLGVDGWALARMEVLTPAEFERECRTANEIQDRPPSMFTESDDLLRGVFYDSLTKFPTLALFRDQARAVISSSPAPDQPFSLLLLDIDGFGSVNRGLGYTFGDQVLVELARRLAYLAERNWGAARLTGDEFVLLVSDAHGRADAIAAQVLEEARRPFIVGGRTIELSASVGVAVVRSVSDFDDGLRAAGRAMCAAKEAGGDQVWRHQPGLIVDESRLDFEGHLVPDRLAYTALLERAALAANECASLEAAAAVVLQQVCVQTGWRAGHLWAVDDGGTRLLPTGVWHVSGPDPMVRFRENVASIRLGKGDGVPGQVLLTGRPALSRDPVAHLRPVDSAIGFPVVVGSEVVAVLEFFGWRATAVDDVLFDAMAAVGAQLGRVVERNRAAAVLAESENRYRMFADTVPALVWVSGTNGKRTFFNRRWLDFTGRRVEQELGDGWAEGVHPDDVARCFDTFLAVPDGREEYEMEYRLRRADGDYRLIIDRASPRFENGVFAGYIGGCVDVTDRREMEHRLRNEELRFRVLVSNAEVTIVVLGADGTVTDEFVPGAGLGYERGASPGRIGFEFVHPDDIGEVFTEFLRVLAEPGVGRPCELRVRAADGSWRWLRSVANNMLSDPVVQGVVITSTDITERRELADRLRDAEERLQQAEARLAQLSAE